MDFKALIACQKAFDLAVEVYEVSKTFSKAECYSLTYQIRRSSRSVFAILVEGYRKRVYQKHFITKLLNTDMENCKSQVSIDFALPCKYINDESQLALLEKSLDEESCWAM